MSKAPIYREQDAAPYQERIKALWEIVEKLRMESPPDLMSELAQAITDLEAACRAVVPISNGSRRVGYGINQSRKAIACDAIVSIVKELRKVRGW